MNIHEYQGKEILKKYGVNHFTLVSCCTGSYTDKKITISPECKKALGINYKWERRESHKSKYDKLFHAELSR